MTYDLAVNGGSQDATHPGRRRAPQTPSKTALFTIQQLDVVDTAARLRGTRMVNRRQ